MMRQAGFENARLVSDTGFNSSPITKGVLIHAHKLAASGAAWEEMST